jgi:trehalose 6-phosphate phosphatase
MKHLLSLAPMELLGLVAAARPLFAFDFDGTLAPITAKREEARMRASTLSLFSQLCRRVGCAVLSGRSRADVLCRLGGAAAQNVVGNHGLEPDGAVAEPERSIVAARMTLEPVVRAIPGVEIEDKVHSLSIHYRRALEPIAALATLQSALTRLGGVRVQPGKMVLNLMPARGANKGDALAKIMDDQGIQRALYVGDDVTDEDVFEHAIASRVVTIRVGKAATSAARYYLQGQWEIDHLLQALVTFLHGEG